MKVINFSRNFGHETSVAEGDQVHGSDRPVGVEMRGGGGAIELFEGGSVRLFSLLCCARMPHEPYPKPVRVPNGQLDIDKLREALAYRQPKCTPIEDAGIVRPTP